jgi:hypothetical protein
MKTLPAFLGSDCPATAVFSTLDHLSLIENFRLPPRSNRGAEHYAPQGARSNEGSRQIVSAPISRDLSEGTAVLLHSDTDEDPARGILDGATAVQDSQIVDRHKVTRAPIDWHANLFRASQCPLEWFHGEGRTVLAA